MAITKVIKQLVDPIDEEIYIYPVAGTASTYNSKGESVDLLLSTKIDINSDEQTDSTKVDKVYIKNVDGRSQVISAKKLAEYYFDKNVYMDMYSYGVEWDTTVSNPKLTRIGNMALHKALPIQSSLQGCVYANGDIQYYLDPNNWNKKVTGEDSVLTGEDGDVMVHHMKFYGKSFINGTKRQVRISTIQIEGDWQEIPEGVIAAYRGYKDSNNKMRSITGVLPTTNISRATMRTYANNNNMNLLYYDVYKWISYWLPVIEYATFDMQSAYNANLTSEGYHQGGLGPGVTTLSSSNWSTYNGYYPFVTTGVSNSLGNFTGVVSYTAPTKNNITPTVQVCRYRGIENIFGEIWTNLDGVLCVYSAEGRKIYTTSDPSKFSDSNYANMTLAGIMTVGHGNGYIKEFNLGNHAEIIPGSLGGSETTYKCDYCYDNTDTGLHTLILGGSASYGGGAGLGYFYAYGSVGNANADIGCRTYHIIA